MLQKLTLDIFIWVLHWFGKTIPTIFQLEMGFIVYYIKFVDADQCNLQ